jgi:hypothetical protein
MEAAGHMMSVSVAIDKSDIRAWYESTHEDGDPEILKFKIMDGQHRISAIKDMPFKVVSFYVMVYIVDGMEEEKKLFQKLNLRKEVTGKDIEGMDTRQRFINVWDSMTHPHENRQCVRFIRRSKRIRDITDSLTKMSVDEIRRNIKTIAQEYKKSYEETTQAFKASAVGKTIAATGIYQLMTYNTKDDSWLSKLNPKSKCA